MPARSICPARDGPVLRVFSPGGPYYGLIPASISLRLLLANAHTHAIFILWPTGNRVGDNLRGLKTASLENYAQIAS